LGSSRVAASCCSTRKSFRGSYRTSPLPFPNHHRSFLCSYCAIIPSACSFSDTKFHTSFEPGHSLQQHRNRCQQRVNLLRNVPKGSPSGCPHQISQPLISHFEACIRADLSFSLLWRALDTKFIPLFYPSNLGKRPLAERVKCKLYFYYARSVVAAAIVDIISYSWNSR
jgi:hypothetical protein